MSWTLLGIVVICCHFECFFLMTGANCCGLLPFYRFFRNGSCFQRKSTTPELQNPSEMILQFSPPKNRRGEFLKLLGFVAI